MKLDPTMGCQCITNEEYRAYFPDWATDRDIDYSHQLMWDSWEPYEPEPIPEPEPEPKELKVPDHWPACNTLVPCSFDNAPLVLNELACTCFSLLVCEMACSEGFKIDPVEGCGCIPEEEVNAYYPDWATERDIVHAEKLMF